MIAFDFAFESAFQQIALLLLIAAALGAVLRMLHQPLIIAFIVVGVLVGPALLDVAPPREDIELFAHLGVALLLFIVGLKLDVRLITLLGPVAVLTGLGQMAATAVLAFVLATALGFATVEALYIAVALTFSSTIIVVKLLSDRREIDQLHGRIALGVLIVQDVAVIVLMIGLSAFGRQDATDLLPALITVAVRGLLFVLAIAALARWLLPRVLDAFARSPELLVLSAAAWAFAVAAVGDMLGFSEEVGAFLAGVALASSPYREALGTRLGTLRDFLLLFFFVQLGLGVQFGEAGPQLLAAVGLSLFVLVGKPLMVMAIMGALRYRRRTSFFTGVSLAQISEFSLIVAALGLELGHIGGGTVGLITLVAVITIAVSSYLIVGARALLDRLSPLLGVFERAVSRPAEGEDEEDLCPQVIIFGLGRFGGRIADHLVADGVSVLGIDFDPQALARAQRRGVPTMYGDAEDAELVKRLPLRCAQWVVSTSPDPATNLVLLGALREISFGGRVALTAHTEVAARRLERGEPDMILRPFVDAADDACRALGLLSASEAELDLGSHRATEAT